MTKKVETDVSQLATNFNASTAIVTYKGVENPTVDTDVKVGGHIKWLFIELNFSAEVITTTKMVHWGVVKNPGGAFNPNIELYNQNNRKFIFKRGKEMLPKNVNTIVKRIVTVRIPRKYSRFDIDDELTVEIACSSTEQINVCGIIITKIFN